MNAGLYAMRRGVAVGARTATRSFPRVFIGFPTALARKFSASAATMAATTAELSKEKVKRGSEGLHTRTLSKIMLHKSV
jgi:hypothetical protein